MRLSRALALLAVAGAMLVTACTSGSAPAPRPVMRRAPGAAASLGGYLGGDVVGGRRARTAKALAAGIDVLGADAVGGFIDRQEADLRRQTIGTGVEVIRHGDELVLRMPASSAFAVGSVAIDPRFASTLREVAQTLGADAHSLVDVLGHTDSTGSEAANQALSVKRAQEVANYLSARGVAAARLGVRGFGASEPLAPNDSDEGRARNRRIEIRVVALTRLPAGG